jgi:hypothetical protein
MVALNKLKGATIKSEGQVVQSDGVTENFRRKSMSTLPWFRVFHDPSLPDLDLTQLDSTSWLPTGCQYHS